MKVFLGFVGFPLDGLMVSSVFIGVFILGLYGLLFSFALLGDLCHTFGQSSGDLIQSTSSRQN